MTTPMVEPQMTDRLIANRYALIVEIGRGEMSTVWRAQDALLRRDVAVKEIQIPPTVPAAVRSYLRNRMLSAVRAAARISQQGMVTILDAVHEGDSTYIVMELVRAKTLAEVVEQDGPLDPGQAALIGLRLLDVLEAAHGKGIVHRNVKPSNVMLLTDGRVKLGDFGIASLQGDPELASRWMVLGSTWFSAPEQASGEESGPAADLWALGATLYYAVEGRPPFGEGDAISSLSAVVGDDPRPMTRAGALAGVITRLLAKQPEDRPSGTQLRERLAAVARGGTAEKAEPEGWAEPRVPPVPVAVIDKPETAVPVVAAKAAPAPVDDRPKSPLAVLRVPLPRLRPDRASATGALSQRRTRWIAALAGLAMAVLAVVPPTIVELLDRVQDRRGWASTTVTAAPLTTAAPGQDRAPAPRPALGPYGQGRVSWQPHHNPAAGFSIRVPSSWTRSTRRNRVVFQDPRTDAYVAITWTDRLADPFQDARDQALQFRSTPGYRELLLQRARFKDRPAADWEFQYTSQAEQVRSRHLTIDGRLAGYVLTFETAAADWASYQPILKEVLDSFTIR